MAFDDDPDFGEFDDVDDDDDIWGRGGVQRYVDSPPRPDNSGEGGGVGPNGSQEDDYAASKARVDRGSPRAAVRAAAARVKEMKAKARRSQAAMANSPGAADRGTCVDAGGSSRLGKKALPLLPVEASSESITVPRGRRPMPGFKPYTLGDYKKINHTRYVEVAPHLAPDLNSDALRLKREKVIERAKEPRPSPPCEIQSL